MIKLTDNPVKDSEAKEITNAEYWRIIKVMSADEVTERKNKMVSDFQHRLFNGSKTYQGKIN